jgi:peptidoglycan/LPS O-acetylase OafA/YrhL
MFATQPIGSIGQEAREVGGKTAGRFYQPELDALRFLAFMLVFSRHVIARFGLAKRHQGVPGSAPAAIVSAANHASSTASYHLSPAWEIAQSLTQFCDFGVCLFFFLSSFLITRLLLIERGSTGTVAIGEFYLRRTLRIWPLYFFFLAFAVLLSIWIPAVHGGWGRVISSVFFVANWPIVFHGWAGSPIEPLWSVSVEEQFYLIWPGFARLGRKSMLGISLLLMVLAVGTLIYLGHRPGTLTTAVWPNSLVQSLFFAGGALTATLGAPETRRSGPWQRLGLLLGGFACWLVASGACHVVRNASPGPLSLVLGYLFILLGTLFIFLAFAGADPAVFPQPVLYLGKISYGLYVFHVLCLALTHKVLSMALRDTKLGTVELAVFHLVSASLALGLTALCATASYRLLEAPFLRLKKRFTVICSRPT